MSAIEVEGLRKAFGGVEALRGVTLAGIASVFCPRERRLLAW